MKRQIRKIKQSINRSLKWISNRLKQLYYTARVSHTKRYNGISAFSLDNYKPEEIGKLAVFNGPVYGELLNRVMKELHNTNCISVIKSTSTEASINHANSLLAKGEYQGLVKLLAVFKAAEDEMKKRGIK